MIDRLKKGARLSAGADETRLLPGLGAESNFSVTTTWFAWSLKCNLLRVHITCEGIKICLPKHVKNILTLARKQWQERPSIYRLAPDGWQKGHPNKSSIAQTTPQESEENVQVPDAWSKLRRQSWARLLQKVYEVDPFVCPKCQGAMSVVAIIEDPKELSKIIEWAQQQERDPQRTASARSPPELALVLV